MITINTATERWLPEIARCRKFFKLFFDRFGGNYWIAGGAILDFFRYGPDNFRDNNKDVDIYFRSESDRNTFINSSYYHYMPINKPNGGSNKQFANLVLKEPINYPQLPLKLDVIGVNYDSPQATIDTFDFTICKAAISHDGFICCDTYFDDLEVMRLVHNGKVFHPTIFERVARYTKKGFVMSKEHSDELFNKLISGKIQSSNNEFGHYIMDGVKKEVVAANDGLPFLEPPMMEISL